MALRVLVAEDNVLLREGITPHAADRNRRARSSGPERCWASARCALHALSADHRREENR
jgi:hypothetical protein